jgi:hypothetical protein
MSDLTTVDAPGATTLTALAKIELESGDIAGMSALGAAYTLLQLGWADGHADPDEQLKALRIAHAKVDLYEKAVKSAERARKASMRAHRDESDRRKAREEAIAEWKSPLDE